MANDVFQKHLVLHALCVVCAVVVSSAAVILRPTAGSEQDAGSENQYPRLGRLLQAGRSIETQFEQISTALSICRLVEFTDAVDPATYDQRKASKDPALSMALDPEQDIGQD